MGVFLNYGNTPYWHRNIHAAWVAKIPYLSCQALATSLQFVAANRQLPSSVSEDFWHIYLHTLGSVLLHTVHYLRRFQCQRKLESCTMSATAGRVAGKVGQAAGKFATKANETGSGKGKRSALQKGAKRDPELYVQIHYSVHCQIFTNARGRSSSQSWLEPLAWPVIILDANPHHLHPKLQSVWRKGPCLGRPLPRVTVPMSISNINIIQVATGTRRPKMRQARYTVSSFPTWPCQRLVLLAQKIVKIMYNVLYDQRKITKTANRVYTIDLTNMARMDSRDLDHKMSIARSLVRTGRTLETIDPVSGASRTTNKENTRLETL